MHSHRLITDAQARAAIDLFEQGLGFAAASTRLGVHTPTLKLLHDRWLVRGTIGAMERRKPVQLSGDEKIEIAKRYLAGEHKVALAKEYDLSSSRPVVDWGKKYRDEGEAAFVTPSPATRGKTLRMQSLGKGDDPDADGLPPASPDLLAPKSRPGDISVAEHRQLQERLLRAEAENAYLKKLWALKRQRQQ